LRGPDALRPRPSSAAEGPARPQVNLWGLDAIKTKGESVAIVLRLVGAAPVREGTGRIARFALRPLAELGRPRVDVLCNMSGIFRGARRAAGPRPRQSTLSSHGMCGLLAKGLHGPAGGSDGKFMQNLSVASDRPLTLASCSLLWQARSAGPGKRACGW